MAKKQFIILKFFKNIILSIKTKKILETKKHNSFSYSDIKKVCVFIDHEYNFIRDIKSIFNSMGAKTIFITSEYSNKEGKIFDNSMGYDYEKKDFKITGNISKEFLYFLDRGDYDLFIGLIKYWDIEKKYIVSKVKSRLKLGINTDHQEIYDVIVNKPKINLDKQFLEQILNNYIKNIEK